VLCFQVQEVLVPAAGTQTRAIRVAVTDSSDKIVPEEVEVEGVVCQDCRVTCRCQYGSLHMQLLVVRRLRTDPQETYTRSRFRRSPNNHAVGMRSLVDVCEACKMSGRWP
jgi:hypothetical protein